MKKRIKALLMVFVMVLTMFASLVANPEVAKAEDLVLKLHYERPDGKYDDWSVWFWEVGGEGNAYEFVEEDGEMVATKTVSPAATEVGYIVRLGEWEAKDVGEDQFIDVSKYISGTVHMYVKSGEKGCEIVLGEDAKEGTKVVSAVYSEKTVVVKTSAALENYEDVFEVKCGEDTVEYEGVTDEGKNKYVIELNEEFDLAASYSLTFEGNEYHIVMPDYYSTSDFEAEFTYEGDDLGATWTKDKTDFRVWAPTASKVVLNLYESGTEGTDDLIESIDMTSDVNGTWVASKDGDLNGVYYTYSVTVNGTTKEACDPYARTTGVNGKRAMVIDLESTNPKGWDKDENPNKDLTINDAVIYELHVRDLSSDENSGIENTGKFLGLTEHGTKTPSGVSTGIDHIKELGITHLHIMPSYDFGSVDESKTDSDQFNWGYDPVNYNVPEGSYSTDPFNGEVRVSEMKQMVQSLHNDDISVVMDVVYNHVYNAEDFCFNQIVPEYFSRVDENGKYSNGSGCGNDTATERAMVKKYIVDSVNYWVEEYHIDGFRFDLVGLIDTETINEIMDTVHEEHPDVIFYGEGWTMSTTMTKEGYTLCTQQNSSEVPGFSFFSDTIRDGLKGNVFDDHAIGYVSGAVDIENTIKYCWMGLAAPWCKNPTQCINYASCHDNLTVFDRLQTSRPDASLEDLIKMNNLAAAVYMTAEGTPFIMSGEEMLRTKVNEDGTLNSNSYASPDSVNSLKWDTLDDEAYNNVFEYYKGLIAFRKEHAALRFTTKEQVMENVSVVDGLDPGVLAFDVKGGKEANGEKADAIYVVFNANDEEKTIDLPEGKWNVYINGEKAGTKVLDTVEGTVTVDAISALVLVQESPSVSPVVIILIVIAVLAVAGIAFVVTRKKCTTK